MASDSQQDPTPTSDSGSASERTRLPFEPAKSRKKTTPKQVPPKQTAPKRTSAAKGSSSKSSSEKASKASPASASKVDPGIPEVISRRMVRRMGFFCGIPTSLGMLTFVMSYIIVSQHWFKLPNVAVVLVSMAFFGLGVLGLSYGALSASWDEDRLGSWLGWNEFTTNAGRVVESWRARQPKT